MAEEPIPSAALAPPLNVACDYHRARIGEPCERGNGISGTCSERMARALGTRNGFALAWPEPEALGVVDARFCPECGQEPPHAPGCVNNQ
jgi:hypothetical protein